jgi:integrase
MADPLTIADGTPPAEWALPGPPAAAGAVTPDVGPTLSETALAYTRQALSPATRRAYASHLRAWEAWCRAKGVVPAPAAPALVANHLAELAGQRAYVTLTSRVSAIVQAHHLLRLPFDLRDPELRKTLQGIARAHGTRPKRQAAPLLTADVIKLAAICGGAARGGGTLRGERDRALILLGFAGAFRRSELVEIRVGDRSFGPHGLSVFLPRSKADQIGEGSLVHVAANPPRGALSGDGGARLARRRRHPPGLGVPPHHPQRRHRAPGPVPGERAADP